MGRKDGKRQAAKTVKSKQKQKNLSNAKSEDDTPPLKCAEKEKEKQEKSEISNVSPKTLSDREKAEKDQCLERLFTTLQEKREGTSKGEYIEKVLNSISELLQLEETLEAENISEIKRTVQEESKLKQEPESSQIEEQEQLCAFCNTLSTTRCTGCRLVFYCDRECQRQHWKLHKDICRPYAIAKRKDAGRILIASRDLKAEDLVLHESPLILGPRSGSSRVCLTCYKRVHGNYRCSICNLPLCSEKCQNGDDHSSFECKVAKGKIAISEGAPDRFYDAVAGLRCLLARRRDPQKWNPIIERFQLHLLSVVGSSESNAELEIILKHRLNIHLYSELATVTDEEISQALGLFQLHSVPTKLPYGEAQALYPMASLLSHSCIPNTRLVWDKEGKKLKVTATEPIPRGTPITTIYTDILWGTRARRDHLQQTRLISCACVRCRDPTELETYFSALVCPRCPKRSFVLPSNPLSNLSQWKCKGCDYQISSEDVLQQTLSLGASVSEALQSPSIPSLEAIQKEWTPRFSSNHYHLHAIKHSLLQLYARSQEKAEDKDENHWEEIAKKEKACKEFLRVCSLLDPALANTIPYVGLTFFEYHKTILQNAKRSFGLAKINTLQLKKRMLLAKELLRKAMEIFKGEEPDTPEGQLYLTCQEERITIGKWMLAVGLV